MKHLIALLLAVALAFPTLATAQVPGLIVKPSQYGVSETIDRLEAALAKRASR